MMPARQSGLVTRRAAGVDLLVRPGDPAATIVLLHGIGGRAASFAPLMGQWPAGPQLIAWDSPGYGGSTPLAIAAASPAVYADALAAVLDDLHVETCSLLGQSLGAILAGHFTARHARRVSRLALLCPAPGYATPAGAALPDALAKRLADHGREGPEAFAGARAHRLVSGPERKPQIVEAVRAAMATVTAAAHAPAVRALAEGNLLADVPAWRCPVLLVAGADDQITPQAGTDRLFAALRARPRGADVREAMHVIGDAGHAVYLEHPASVAAVAGSFLAGAA